MHALFDETVGRLDLQTVGAPAESPIWSWVSETDQVYPEGVLESRPDLLRAERHAVASGTFIDLVECAIDVVDDRRRLDERVGGDHIHGLRTLLGWKFRKRVPDAPCAS